MFMNSFSILLSSTVFCLSSRSSLICIASALYARPLESPGFSLFSALIPLIKLGTNVSDPATPKAGPFLSLIKECNKGKVVSIRASGVFSSTSVSSTSVGVPFLVGLKYLRFSLSLSIALSKDALLGACAISSAFRSDRLCFLPGICPRCVPSSAGTAASSLLVSFVLCIFLPVSVSFTVYVLAVPVISATGLSCCSDSACLFCISRSFLINASYSSLDLKSVRLPVAGST